MHNILNIPLQMPSVGFKTSRNLLVPEEASEYSTGYALYWQQFRALFTKRWHHAKRDKKGVFAQVGILYKKTRRF